VVVFDLKKKKKIIIFFFWGGGGGWLEVGYLQTFTIHGASWNLSPVNREG